MAETRIQSPVAEVYSLPKEQGMEHLNFSGSVDDALQELRYALTLPSGIERSAALTSLPAAVIEGVINYHADHPKQDALLPLRIKAVDLAAKIYNGETVDPALIDDVQENASHTDIDLASMYIAQDLKNPNKWEAYDPAKIIEAAQNIHNNADGKPILLIPVAHGATVPGILAGNYLRDRYGQDVTVFPIRASHHRLGTRRDTKPAVTPAIENYIEEQMQGKIVVILDDLSHTGATMNMFRFWVAPYAFRAHSKVGFVPILRDLAVQYGHSPIQRPLWLSY